MREQIEILLEAAKAYYVDAKSIMSDERYDKLWKDVKNWENEHNIDDKITDKVCLGYFEGSKTEKVEHLYPMLSVENDNVRVIDKEVIITPKIDGAAVELVYVDGVLYRQLTRGDGTFGSDITKFVLHGVPKTINHDGTVVIRGELHCPNYKEYGKSHRNVVAGALGKVDFEDDRGLYFVPYWTNLFREFATYEQELLWLFEEQCFSPIPYVKSSKSVLFSNDFMEGLFYPIDGYVVRYNNNEFYGESTAHHYKGIWCWKCIEENVETVIIDVEWSKSKNGVWTPVAMLKPVEIDESTVSRINLMHLDYIAEKGICIGDTVLIRKAKGIIPEIVKVVKEAEFDIRTHIYLTHCPDCGNELIQDGIYLRFDNPECSMNMFILHFCSVMNIKGLALKGIEKLNLTHPLNLYNLTEEQLTDILGAIGSKIYKEIRNSFTMPVVKLIAALNPPKAKENTLTKIFNEYPRLNILGDKTLLTLIEGIGEKKADALSKWYVSTLMNLIPILDKLGFNLTPKVLKCKIEIAVTGTFPIKRNDFKVLMSTKGVEVKSLTKKSSILVTGDKASQSKIDKATKYCIPVVPYHKFIKDLNSSE